MNISLFPSGRVYNFLCYSVSDSRKEQITKSYAELEDSLLWKISNDNHVESIVAHALMDAYGKVNIPGHWLTAHENTYHYVESYLFELDRIAAILADRNIPLIALKNSGIARGIYSCKGCCPMGDLDVLVKKQHFKEAHNILFSEGYNFEFRNPLLKADLHLAERQGGSEYWKILPDGSKLWLELQWRPIAGRWMHPDKEPKAEELINRSIPISNSCVRLLNPEDNLLQVSLHTAKHSFVRAPGFRLHLDVDRIVRSQKVDWAVFVKRVSAIQLRTAVYFSLVIPNILFGTPIPDAVLSSLKPNRLKEEIITRWLKRVDIFNSGGHKFGHLGFIIFTALLFDNWNSLWKGIFPAKSLIYENYGVKDIASLPLFYIKRLWDLSFRRSKT